MHPFFVPTSEIFQMSASLFARISIKKYLKEWFNLPHPASSAAMLSEMHAPDTKEWYSVIGRKMNRRRFTMTTKMYIALLLMCLVSSYGYAQEKMDLTNKGMIEEQGKVMMKHAKIMLEQGKELMSEGDKMMKAGMDLMEGKTGEKGSWSLDLNLEDKGRMIKDRADAIWKEGDAMVKEGLKMMESKFMVEMGELMIKNGVMLMKEGISLRELSDMMIKEGQMMLNK